MSSNITTTHLGRSVWSSIWGSADVFAPKFLSRPQPLRPSGFFTRPLPRRAHHSSPRSFHTFRWPSFPTRSRVPPKNVRRSCTSGGLLLLGLTSNSSATPSVVATCTAATDSALATGGIQKANISSLAHQAWRRSAHPRPQAVEKRRPGLRNNSSDSRNDKRNVTRGSPESAPKGTATGSKHGVGPTEQESLANSVSKYLHLPKIPHRPSREELLAAASGFWERLKVRFKWFSIRSMRPWNADEWGAFVSWFLFGHLVWILVGTTTFFSLIILTINTVFAQETLAKWIGDYLTQSAGLTVVFESAIVPKWKDGVITLKNVFVSRRPGQLQSSVKKGSLNEAAEAAALRQAGQDPASVEEDDGNYTQMDVTINTVNVTLSFLKWWNGRGLLKDVEVKGVRGVVDRTSVSWPVDPVDPLSYRHEHNPGDFELDYFKIEDLLVTVHQPNGFRPFPVSIYSCELPQLRKQWLFYDFLSATHMSGSFDGSLFTIHPRQIHGVAATSEGGLGDSSAWKKFSRVRIDGLKIDHLNRGIEGPFGWIYEGNVDIIADLMLPADAADGIGKVVAEFYDKMEEAVTSNRYLRMLDGAGARDRSPGSDRKINESSESRTQPRITTPQELRTIPPTPDSSLANPSSSEEAPSYLVMDLRIHLNDVRAAVPLFNNPHISYVNQALVRPIVAYINAKRTYIPINCRIVKRLPDFDGSWTVYDCGMMDDMSAEVYAAFARNVEDQHSRVRRLKRVGLWTMSLIVHALLAGVAGDLM